ncbi:hypothetical protein [Virgisporangium aurantiacum]|uniref:Uncharacterized protein n=1 Tax=Virgisporangium aurantiacum TaxID=175570 RepID=A0A8J4E6B4_9ACTN|nr:hypothetical protein [Virgisporangium aurantiacum]GIJ63895.1 hypothetical protein Vau01_114110 [Virgisporangium aurantiacum]
MDPVDFDLAGVAAVVGLPADSGDVAVEPDERVFAGLVADADAGQSVGDLFDGGTVEVGRTPSRTV